MGLARRPAVLAVLVGLLAAPAQGAPAIVDAEWLEARLCAPDIVALDLRRSAQSFAAEHIPCSVYSDYYRDGWRARHHGIDNMVPPVARLEALIGGLGIANRSHVVLIGSAIDAYSAAELARVYFLFRYLGHDAVSILDGGIAAWTGEWDRDIETGAVTPEPAAFTATPRAHMIADRDDVMAAMADGSPLVDMRANDHFLGINSSRVVVRPGTIPGAVNLPMSWLVVSEGLSFRPAAQIRRLWRAGGLDADAPQILFCNSGLESAVGWLALAGVLGNDRVRLYDGSLAEWSGDPALPMTVAVPLD